MLLPSACRYHYVHHAKFECNYGAPMTGFIDQWCGTFRERLGQSSQYCGEQREQAKEQTGEQATDQTGYQSGYQTKEQGAEKAGERAGKQAGKRAGEQAGPTRADLGEKGASLASPAPPATQREWSSDGYLGLPVDRLHTLYTLYWVGLWPLTYWGAVVNRGAAKLHVVAGRAYLPVPTLIAATVAYGPAAQPVGIDTLVVTQLASSASWGWLSRIPAATHLRRLPRGKCSRGARFKIGA